MIPQSYRHASLRTVLPPALVEGSFDKGISIGLAFDTFDGPTQETHRFELRLDHARDLLNLLRKALEQPKGEAMKIVDLFESKYGANRSGELHGSVLHVLSYFEFAHLPERLQEVSEPFAELACDVANRRPKSPETTVALRKLLEAKDCAVRAMLDS